MKVDLCQDIPKPEPFSDQDHKKGLKIRSKSELAFRIKSDLRSDQKMIVQSNFDLFNQDRHHYDFLSFEEVLER